MSNEQIKIVENLLNKGTECLSFGELQAITAMIYDIHKALYKEFDWIPVEERSPDRDEWVELAIISLHDNTYLPPIVARGTPSFFGGVSEWIDQDGNDIEDTRDVLVTHWRHIQNYEVGVYHL